MVKYGVDLPASHWDEIQSILARDTSRQTFENLTEQWMNSTAELLRAPGILPLERSNERLVKTFCRIAVFEARRQDLLNVSYVIKTVGRGSRTTVGQWVDEVKEEVLDQAQVHTRLSAIPNEFRSQAEDFILELWDHARNTDEKGPAAQQLERLQQRIESLERALAKNQSSTQDLIRENERMAREVARAQNAQAESEKERAVAVAQLEGVELALKGEQERYDQAVKEIELARGLAETHRKQLMMEIDRVRTMDQGWEAKVRVLKQDYRIELEQLQANLKKESSYNTILLHKCAQLEGQLSKLVKPGEKLKQGASVPVETPNGSK